MLSEVTCMWVGKEISWKRKRGWDRRGADLSPFSGLGIYMIVFYHDDLYSLDKIFKNCKRTLEIGGLFHPGFLDVSLSNIILIFRKL